MRKKIEVNRVIFRKELYPRLKINEEKVREYEEILGVLPPIIVNQDNILIDGMHRLQAFKNREQKEIDVEVLETKDDDDLFLKAVELNAKHGYQLTRKEKKDEVIRFYAKELRGEARSYDVKRLRAAFSIPDSTFSDWTKDLEDELEGQRLERILELHLRGLTQEEIGKEVGAKQNTISDKTKEIEQFMKEISENPNSEIPIKYRFLAERMKILSEFRPFLYNVWNVQRLGEQPRHFGNMPIEFVENLLYYYTEPFDVVYDPFAGGGTTIDACEKWFRKFYVSDLNPTDVRKNDIKEWDITKGLPKDLDSPKLVLLDPPYWKQAEGQYSNDANDLGNMPLDKFYATFEKFAKELYKKMKEGSYITFIIQGTQWKNDMKLEDHAFKMYRILEDVGFAFEQRIICPYSTEQYNAQMVEKAKKEKIILTLYRDLVVMKR